MQQVIVYRNPLEAAMWNALGNDGAFLLFGIIILLAALWVVTYLAVDWFRMRVLRSTTYYGRSRTAEAWVASLVTIAAAAGLHLYNIHG